MNRSEWSFDTPRRQSGLLSSGLLERAVGQIATLARNEEACKLLGVEGVLEGQLDLAFLNDPLEWLASDIANALAAAERNDDDTEPAVESLTLDIVVAEFRLCQLVQGTIDENELIRRVRRLVEQS
jgi:hypothetical protein